MRLNTLPVVPAKPALADRARDVAINWGLPFAERAPASDRLVLTAERLQLESAQAAGPIFVDFVGGPVGHRHRFGGGRGQPIAKAVGLKGGESPSVLDATAGFGRDAFVLAALGCRVWMVERSPVVAALLDDGLRRGEADPDVAPVRERMVLQWGEAIDVMAGLGDSERPDVVYLDPMFPPRTKSARVKKEMQILHQLLGNGGDEAGLLSRALATARMRVVVKRPAWAGPLSGPNRTLTFPTRKNRFDVYVIKALRLAGPAFGSTGGSPGNTPPGLPPG